MQSEQKSSRASFDFVLEDNLKTYRSFLLENSAPPVRLPKGTVISSGGSPAPCVYFLLEGLVKVSVINIHGYERILGYHRKNSLFVMDGLRKSSSVVVTTTALTELSALRLSMEDLVSLFSKDACFAAALVLYYSDVLKLMCYDAESQSSNSVQSKLANFILLYTQCDEYQRQGYLPFSQAELASAVGASRVQVARICAQWKAAGLISVQKRRIDLLDQEAFIRYASFQGFDSDPAGRASPQF